MNWEDEVRWPAFRLTEPVGIAIVCTDARHLRSARYLGIRDLQALQSLYIVDSCSTKYEFDGPEPVAGDIGLLGRLFHSILNPRVEVSYAQVRKTGKVSLERVKRVLTENVRKYPDFYWEMDIESPEHFVEEINAAKNIDTLFRLFGC